MRLLLVGESELMAWVIQHLTPTGVQVERSETLAEALSVLSTRPPDAAIFTIGPGRLPWDSLARLCRNHEPPIPFLCWSSVLRDPAEARIEGVPRDRLIALPLSLTDLEASMTQLLEEARAIRSAPRPSDTNSG